jgi:hypothetical protein
VVVTVTGPLVTVAVEDRYEELSDEEGGDTHQQETTPMIAGMIFLAMILLTINYMG